jgi:hypothetical protein
LKNSGENTFCQSSARACTHNWVRVNASGPLIVAINDHVEQITGNGQSCTHRTTAPDEAPANFANESQKTATADYTTPPKSMPSLASASASSADAVGFVSR